MPQWKIEFTKAAAKQTQALDPQIQTRIRDAIREKLLVNPDKYLIPLHGDLTSFYKFRIGTYRLLCQKNGITLIITVVRIGHRREIYN